LSSFTVKQQLLHKPKQNTLMYTLIRIKWKTRKCHTAGYHTDINFTPVSLIFLLDFGIKSNRNIRETGVKLISVAHIYMPIYITGLA